MAKFCFSALTLFVTAILSSASTYLLAQSISGDSLVCSGDSKTYNYTPFTSGYSYTWTAFGGDVITSSANSADITWGNPGAGMVTVSVKNASDSIVATDTLSIDIKSFPNPVFTSSFESRCTVIDSLSYDSLGYPVKTEHIDYSGCIKVCDSTWVTYYAQPHAGSSYTWLVHGEITFITYGDSLKVYWGAPGAGYVKLIETNGHGCIDEKESCITIIERPHASFITFPAGNSFCTNQEINFIDQSAGTSYSDIREWAWNFDDGNTSDEQNPIHTFSASGSYIVTLIVRNACYCADTLRMTIDVYDDVVPDIECASVVCEGAEDCYSTSVSSSAYNWTVSGGTITSGQNTPEVCVVWSGGPYPGVVSLQCPGNCAAPTVLTVPVIAASAPVSGSETVCVRSVQSYSVPVFPGCTYNWTVTGGSIYAGQGTNEVFIKWPAIPGTGIVLVSYHNSKLNCGGSGNLAVVIKDLFSVTGEINVCEGDNQVYTAQGTPASSYSWEVFDQSGNSIIPGAQSGSSFPVSWNFGPGVFEVRATNLAGVYCNTRSSVFVKVNSRAMPENLRGTSPVCPNRTYTYMADASHPGYYLEWNITGGTPLASGADLIDVTWGATPPYIVQVRQVQKSAPGCTSQPLIMNVVPTIQAPQPINGNSQPAANCVTTYNVPVSEGVDKYEWSLSNPLTGSIIENFNATVDIQWNNVTVNTSVVLTLKATICGSIQTSTFDIVVTPLAQPVISAPAQACVGELVNFTVSGPTGSNYEWDFDDGTNAITTSPNANHTFTSAGSRGVKVTVNLAMCNVPAFGDHQITINPLPTAVISSPHPLSYCSNSPSPTPVTIVFYAAIQSGSTYAYQWYRNNSPITGATSSSHSITFTGVPPVGNYHVEITEMNTGCKKVSNVLTVSSAPCTGPGSGPGSAIPCTPSGTPSFTYTINTPTCGEVQFTGNLGGGTSPVWNFGDNNSSTALNPVHTYNASGQYRVTLSALYSGCPNSVTQVVEIPINAKFTFEHSCGSGNNFDVQFKDLSENTATHTINSWAWTITGSSTWTSSAQNPLISLPAGASYTVKLEIGSVTGKSCEFTSTITVPPKADASFTGAASACEGVNTEFINTSSGKITSYTWTFGDGSVLRTTNASKTWEPLAVATTYAVTLSISDATGCTDSYSQNSIIYPNNLSGNVNPSNPAPVCQGSSVTLSYLADAGSTAPSAYSWSTTATTATINASKTDMYRVTVKDTNGCAYTTAPVNVGVTYVPKPVINAKSTYCFGENVVFNVNYGPSYTYAWKKNGIPVSTGHTYIEPAFGAANYEVSITSITSGCSRSSGLFNITTFPLPATSISAFPSPLCEGSPIDLTASGSGSWQWSTGSSFQTITVSDAGPYAVILTDTNGCRDKDQITICPIPDMSSVMWGCYTICSTEFVTIPAPNGHFSHWEWLLDGSPFWSGTGAVPSNETSLAGTYILHVTSYCGCESYSKEFVLEVLNCGDINCVSPVMRDLPLASNACETASELRPGAACTIGSSHGLTNTALSDCGSMSASSPHISGWYKFIPESAGEYTISTDNGVGELGSDTRITLLDDCPDNGGITIACNDNQDNPETNTNILASVVTTNLTAWHTYYIRVDAPVGNQIITWCINVFKNETPVNDCILNAMDITCMADSLSTSCDAPFVGSAFFFNPPDAHKRGTDNDAPGNNYFDISLPEVINCRGPVNLDNTFQGVWFKLEYKAVNKPAFVNFYPNNGGNSYIATLFKKVATVNCDGPLGSAELTYIDCSAGDGLPGSNGDTTIAGRDKAFRSFNKHPRLDLTAHDNHFADGDTLFIFLSVDTGLFSGVNDGIVNVYFERADSSGYSCDGMSADKCPGTKDIGCQDPNQDITISRTCLTNAGLSGNLYMGNAKGSALLADPGEPLEYNAVPGASGKFQRECTGTEMPGLIHTLNNNSGMVNFRISSDIDTVMVCDTTVIHTIDSLITIVCNLFPDSSVIIYPDSICLSLGNPVICGNVNVELLPCFASSLNTSYTFPNTLCEYLHCAKHEIADQLHGFDAALSRTICDIITLLIAVEPTGIADPALRSLKNIFCDGGILTFCDSVTTIPCAADIDIQVSNIRYGGVNGAVGLFHVTASDTSLCNGSAPAVMTGVPNSFDKTLCLYPVQGGPGLSPLVAMPNSTYTFIADGQEQLVKYDLQINIKKHTAGTSVPCGEPCGGNTISGNSADEKHKESTTGIIAALPLSSKLAINYVKPVPAGDVIEISYNNNEENGKLTIYDMTGKKLYFGQLQSAAGVNARSINISGFSPGIYLLSIENSVERAQARFIKVE